MRPSNIELHAEPTIKDRASIVLEKVTANVKTPIPKIPIQMKNRIV